MYIQVGQRTLIRLRGCENYFEFSLDVQIRRYIFPRRVFVYQLHYVKMYLHRVCGQSVRTVRGSALRLQKRWVLKNLLTKTNGTDQTWQMRRHIWDLSCRSPVRVLCGGGGGGRVEGVGLGVGEGGSKIGTFLLYIKVTNSNQFVSMSHQHICTSLVKI